MRDIHAAFDQVRATEGMKASTAQFLRRERARQGRGAPSRTRSGAWAAPLAAVCAVLVLLVVGGAGWRMFTTPAAYVSIDVNPSVELVLNRFDKVVSAQAWNEDGESALEGVPLRGKGYAEAIRTLLTSAALEPYLTNEDGELVFTVAAADAARQAELLAGVADCAEVQSYGGACYGADMDSVDQAHRCGMSLGKYTAWQTLCQYGDTLTQEECHGMTMGELHRRLQACEDGQHHGSAQGQGSASAALSPSAAPIPSAAPTPTAAPSPSAVPTAAPAPSVTANGSNYGGHHGEHHGGGHG